MSIVTDFIRGVRMMQRVEGWQVAARYSLLPLVDFHRAVVLRRSLEIPFPPAVFPPGVMSRLATLEDFELFKDVIPPIRLKRFKRKLKSGELCLIVEHEGKGVALGWGSFMNSLTLSHTPLELGPRDLYLWGAYVTPQWRSKGIMTAMAFSQLRLWHERGYDYTYQITDRFNAPALRFAEKMGCEVIANITTLRLSELRIARRVSFEVLHRQIATSANVNTTMSSQVR